VREVFQRSAGGRRSLDRPAFEDFFVALCKAMAAQLAAGAARTYGLGVLGGIVAIHVSKSAVRAVPIAGTIASPFLSLAPTLILGPIVGVLAVWGHKQGDIFAARRFFEKSD